MEYYASLLIAGAAGFAVTHLLGWLAPAAGRVRAVVLALIPPALLFAVFLAFFEGSPVGEDWLWLGIGVVYFWPWYLSWCLGCAGEWLVRNRWKRARGNAG
ncbi:hypothetical protein [Erythrobacter sp. JK5]|uniref:hypothetical protein n=1 Tax=Erythrobacter sp. JK5 TaxID=2829500 RepID=UPI001BAB1424|nr:hypothetical protein [Erythrobacter sp. JK5]QUL38310.1 hypothetical protein KDC96_02520 [Erythrobacter sp. JK5]